MSSNTYLKVSNMQYPLFQGDIRLMYPHIGEDFYNPDPDIVEVDDTSIPECGINDILTENKPVFVNGKWIRQFSIRPMTDDEKKSRDEAFQIMFNTNIPDYSASGIAPDVIG